MISGWIKWPPVGPLVASSPGLNSCYRADLTHEFVVVREITD